MVCGHTLVCEYALSSAVSSEGVLTVSLSLYYHEVTSYMLLLIAVPLCSLFIPYLQTLSSVNLTGPLQAALQAERDAVDLAGSVSSSLSSIRATYNMLNTTTAAGIGPGQEEVSAAELQVANIASSETAVTTAVDNLLQSVNATTPSSNTSLAELAVSIADTTARLSSADIDGVVARLEGMLEAQRASTRQLQQDLAAIEDEFAKFQQLFASLPTSCDDNV